MTKQIEALKLALEALEDRSSLMKWQMAQAAIKEALAQPEQEPKCGVIIEVFGKDWRLDYMSLPLGKHKLYTQQYIYTAPQQRKPLTDEEIETIAKEHIAVGTRSFEEFARRIEAAHGIKGEA